MQRNYIAALVSICLLTASPCVLAENHALIMGVSAYIRSPLPGVVTDIDRVKKLAGSMGVSNGNIVVRSDRELTLDGMRRTLDDFAKRIKVGDRALIYFSGHGTSYADSAGLCEQAIVTQDMQWMRKQEFHERIKPIIEIAGKTFVFLDTCFSGGVFENFKSSTRDIEEFPRAKYVQTKMGGDNTDCSRPVNVVDKGTRDFEAEAAQVTPNYYFLAASAPNEVAIDGGLGMGGWATSAFVNCATGSGADENGDGVITLEEATRCAQNGVNLMMTNGRRRPGFPYNGLTLTAGSGSGAAATPIAFGVASAQVPITGTAPLPVKINSSAFLETIYRGADPGLSTRLIPTKTNFKIGSDFLEFDVTPSRAGYLTLFSVGSSGKIFQLFPNRFDANNRLEGGATVRLPRPEWRLRSRGPAGTSRFLAVISSTPDRFAGLGSSDGPFISVENTQGGAHDIVRRLLVPVANCAAPSRDFEVEGNPCGSNYGAGLAEVLEAK